MTVYLPLQGPGDEDHNKGKSKTQPHNNAIAKTLAQGGRKLDLVGGHGIRADR